MRVLMIVACLMLIPTPPALACFGEEVEPAGGSLKMAMPHRAYADEGAEASSVSGARIAGAGLAALALIAVVFRALGRASDRARSVEAEPLRWPIEGGIRLDPGHEWPEPRQAVEDEESLSGALAIR